MFGAILKGAASLLLFLVWLPDNMVCVGHHFPNASTRTQGCLAAGPVVWIFLNLEPKPFLPISKSPQAFCSSDGNKTDKLWVSRRYSIPSPGCWWAPGILDIPWLVHVTLISAPIYKVFCLVFFFLIGCSLLASRSIQTMGDDII